MTEEEKRRQQATQFAAKQERSARPKVEGAARAPSNIAPKAYSAGQDSSLRQKATRLDGKASVIGQSANNRAQGQSLLQPRAEQPQATPSRDVAQTVADFTAGGIDQNIIGDQLDDAQDEEKDLFDDIFGLDEEEEEDEYNFNQNYLA